MIDSPTTLHLKPDKKYSCIEPAIRGQRELLMEFIEFNDKTADTFDLVPESVIEDFLRSNWREFYIPPKEAP